MDKLKKVLILVSILIVVTILISFYYVNQKNKQDFIEKQQKIEQAQKEMEVSKELLIGIIDSLSELHSFRKKVRSGINEMKTGEIGKLLEVTAHRSYLDVNKFSSSEYVRELSLGVSDTFKQLEDYGVQMNVSPNKSLDDFGVVINDLPKNNDIVLDYLFNGKLKLNDDDKSYLILRIDTFFKDELAQYEKYLITRSSKDFGQLFTEDITAIFMRDILKDGYVRLK
jgi:hypothetical protein